MYGLPSLVRCIANLCNYMLFKTTNSLPWLFMYIYIYMLNKLNKAYYHSNLYIWERCIGSVFWTDSNIWQLYVLPFKRYIAAPTIESSYEDPSRGTSEIKSSTNKKRCYLLQYLHNKPVYIIQLANHWPVVNNILELKSSQFHRHVY